MDFKQAVIHCVRDKYADFGGRASRSEFWYFILAQVVLMVVLSILRLDWLAWLASLALLIPTLAAGSRRLHDTGKSGWFQLIGLIPLIGGLVVLYWLVQPSIGPNEYGAGPGPDATAALPPGAA